MHALAFALGAVLLMSSTQTPYEEDANPLTRNSGVYTDRLGNVVFSDENDPEEAVFGEQDEYIGVGAGAAADMLRTHGVHNADFRFGPPNPDAPIDDMNPLPSWRLTNVQGGIVAYWVEDASAPSGHAVRFEADSMASGDEAYLEQVVPLLARLPVHTPSVQLGTGVVDGNVRATFYAQPLTIDGADTGTGIDLSSDGTTARTEMRLSEAPLDGAFMRLRFGMSSGGAETDVSRLFYGVWNGRPNIVYTTIVGSNVSMPATGTDTAVLVSANASGTPVAGASRFVVPDRGWVASISAKSSAAVSGADLEVGVFDGSNVIGPVATIAAGLTVGSATAAYSNASNSFTSTAELRFQVEVPSGTLTSTTNDYVVTAVIAIPTIDSP
jgi:hypothetical protein